MSVRESFTDNLSLSGAEGSTDWITATTLSLGFARLGERTSFSAQGWASPTIFEDDRLYGGARFGLGASAERGLSRRARARLLASYSDGLNVEQLFASHLGLSQLDLQSFSGALGVSYAVGPATTAVASLETFWTRYSAGEFFDSSRLPGEVLAPPDVLTPLGRQAPASGLPAAPDATVEVLRLLAVEGLEATRIDYGNWRASASLAHAFSSRTSGTAAVGYRRTREESALQGQGGQIDAQLGMSRTLDSGASLSASYSAHQSRFPSLSRTHSLSLRGGKAVSRRLSLDASAGASYLQGPGGASSGWTVIGGAGLSLALRRGSVAARYERTRYQSVVSGSPYTTDAVHASAGRRLGRRLAASAYADYRTARDAFGLTEPYRAAVAGVSLALPIGRRGSGGASYAYQRFARGEGRSAGRSVFSVFVSYALSGR